jgi:hypothetical protein
MGKVIRIDDDLWEVLKSRAEPLVDTPASVLRRIFEENGLLPKGEEKKAMDKQPKKERRKNG